MKCSIYVAWSFPIGSGFYEALDQIPDPGMAPSIEIQVTYMDTFTNLRVLCTTQKLLSSFRYVSSVHSCRCLVSSVHSCRFLFPVSVGSTYVLQMVLAIERQIGGVVIASTIHSLTFMDYHFPNKQVHFGWFP